MVNGRSAGRNSVLGMFMSMSGIIAYVDKIIDKLGLLWPFSILEFEQS